MKRYQGGIDEQLRRGTELAALERLPSGFPVPRVLGVPEGALRLEQLGGMHGQDLIDEGLARPVLRSCGELLRRLQQVDVSTVFPDTAVSTGWVVVHGDYGPNNMLFDQDTFRVTALLDWEWAHPGDRIEDVAWCEWIVRRHHPRHVDALDDLFAGYGVRPSWARRQQAAAAKCEAMVERFRNGPAAARKAWQEHLTLTLSWTE
ncbi:phosphotransferase family protein [Paractinoplanes lichenicola]|uniref:Phosphotransferase n=1 Tax=Paractinoplanes lichenicola TaxID=2802976 RepID=A0ABS1VTI3_9ACTN|nr:phosphotransferase [Actinoplanes lichenicola]MBL7257778.1 phosphotransferase [Actinoplanes lichenicola]